VPETTRTRVLALVETGPVEIQITAALSNQPDFELVDILSTLDKVAQEIRAARPDLILVDHQIGGQPTLDTLDELALQFPSAALVAMLPLADPVYAQQVMLAGARAFIIQPFTQVNLLSTLRRVRELEARRRQPTAAAAAGGVEDSNRPLHILAVYSPRGGVGCSTVAINLAVALKEETDQRVLLLEGKLLFGHLGLMLNIRTPSSIADLVPHMHALEDTMVREVVAEHVSGVHVLLCPTGLEVAQGIRPEVLYNIVTGLRTMYDFIVVDTGSFLNDNAVTLLDAADRVLLVTVPDLASLHDTTRFVRLSRSLAYPEGKVNIILNQAGTVGGVKTNDIETALRHEVFASIPDDGPNSLRSINRGIPLLLKYPRSPASRAFQQLAKTLVAIGSEAASATASASAPTRRGRAQPAGARAG